MNDTIDVLNIKGDEFSNTSIGSIGDLDGLEFKLKYSITNDLQLNYIRSTQNIQYTGGEIKNTNNELFLRYNITQNKYSTFNSGISIDFGYVSNTLDDYYMSDITSMNAFIDRIGTQQGLDDIEILQIAATGNYALVNNTTQDVKLLSASPYVALKDTSDESYYLRLLTGFYTKKTLYDFYLGYKKTKIKNSIVSNSEVENLVNNNSNITLPLSLNRDEYMLFAGFNITRDMGSFITEFNYEYERFFRDNGLDYINFNHVVNATISKPITDNFLVFVGGKIMYRQFNGQIPYLYNEYSQTTYDHKYGYAKVGLQYNFSF